MANLPGGHRMHCKPAPCECKSGEAEAQTQHPPQQSAHLTDSPFQLWVFEKQTLLNSLRTPAPIQEQLPESS
eukprot:2623811-Rhodomonas_salina.1